MSADSGWGAPPPEPVFTAGPARWRAPVARHRPSGTTRAASVLGTLLVLVAVVAAGGAVTGSELNADERFRPFVITGEVGEPVAGDTFEVTVLGARAAAAIADRPGWRHDTGGVWLLVRVRLVAHQEVATIGVAQVRDRKGRAWSATERVQQDLTRHSYQLQPGVPVEGEIAFEVPVAVAGELTVRLGEAPEWHPMTPVVEVPLHVDEAMISDVVASTEAVTEPGPEESPAPESDGEPDGEVEPVLLEPPEVVFPGPPPPTRGGADP